MNNKEFQEVLDLVLCKCTETLGVKAGEYATDDRLHNFKIAAKLQHCTPITALAGMMCKHTVSVYDLIQKHEQGEEISQAMWDEKIGDSINYLILLSALIKEEEMNKSSGVGQTASNTNSVCMFSTTVDQLISSLNDVMVPTRETAENILENAKSIISAYGRLTLEDFCDLFSISAYAYYPFNASYIYWTDFSEAKVEKNAHGTGYSIIVPKNIIIERTDKN